MSANNLQFAPSSALSPGRPEPDHRGLKRLIWLYFWLLIFEGALRKWAFPGLSNYLLLVRDPVLVLLYISALLTNVFPKGILVPITLALGLITFAVSLVANPGPFFVALYGFRSNFFHLPLIFLMATVLTLEDVKKIGFWTLVITAPMALLIVAQFRAPGDSVVNEGFLHTAGQLDSAMGKIRPYGTFSFTSGCSQFLTLAAAFLLFSLIESKVYPRWLRFTAAPALILSVALSGSRTSLSTMTVLIIGVGAICVSNPKFLGGSVNILVTLVIGYILVGSWSIFSEGVDVLDYRVGGASGVQTGLIDRYLGGFLSPFEAAGSSPFFGSGLGMGTNAGATLISGERNFLLAEDELSRIILEVGPILGFSYILLRVAIIIQLGSMAFAALKRDNPLPVLLFFNFAPLMLSGQFGQPTTLGFGVFGAGLCLAATRDEQSGASEADRPAAGLPTTLRRGRSPYAEHLHSGYPA